MDASATPSKVCAACGGRYPGDALFCPTDGSPLQSPAAAERDSNDPYLGQEISGHIEIRQLVGVGAMGRVYRAFQRGIDRDVAVKILHRELSANAQLVARFTREAKVASRLQHPNVVQVLLAGQLPDRALYMAMEYLDGLSLQSALAAAGGALPLPRALHIALQLCDAVGEAHAQGIVHRDLKPENVMLVRRGADPDCVKVLDFGIARINWGEQSVATAAGLIFGTARYISPEGAQGNAVGPASDVYSIGTLLYQMLAGRTPFDGDQAVGLLVQQIHDPAPELRSRAAHVPEPIAAVVMASLAKDPSRREPDARALGQAIFDAAKLAGLSPDELSRPMMKRQLPPARTKPLESSPALEGRLTPPAPSVEGPPLAASATVKWEPPTEFQAKLVAAASGRSASSVPASPDAPRARLASGVERTIDDMMVDAAHLSPSSPALAAAVPERDASAVPRTMPGELEPPPRTQYASYASSPEIAPGPHAPAPERRSRAWIVVGCFVLGAAIALGWTWRAGKLGGEVGEVEEERFVARATDAMFAKRFHEPPGDNVKEITDEGLQRWPNDRKLVDVRVRAASELTSQAIAHRAAGDVLEALKLARVAHELDPLDASTKRLLDQYEAELASFSPSAAPTLAPPRTGSPGPVSKSAPPGPAPSPTRSSTPAPPPQSDYKVLVDVSGATPKLGQTVELTARVAPNKGAFEEPSFTIAGPGVPGGVRMPAQSPSPGVFKASYAFLEAGRFEVVFSARESGRAISARRAVTAGSVAPSPTPAPGPTPSGSVKWM
jgi:serine/threonine-protein kinase